ncbi:MAG: DUF5063 domain-containing protein [Paludibacteraceae bacterium]|nr:DUF5063 domain-containing protein [Paludibacteraceae bacterium]MBR6043410.1 DUF5063 domain-containing protein [Paludibacteraceae bacterium]MCR5569738.1 DUF5063 domain-containing protein [Paludibacteraceae bacterium]
MQKGSEANSSLYSTNVVEFVTVANEYCCQLEQCGNSNNRDFLDRMSKIIPLLYLKTALLPELISNLSDDVQSFVTEDDYEAVRRSIAHLLGELDNYLDTQVSDMQYSLEPLPASISENLADVYQDLKDMILNFNSANGSVMIEAIVFCKDNFKNVWGQKLLSSLVAIHNALYSSDSDFTSNESEENDDDKNF